MFTNKNVMAYFYSALVVLCAIVCSPANTSAADCRLSLSGNVTDNSNQPIGGVVVHIFHDSIGTTTDSLGNFQLPPLCEGKIVLVCDAVGFKSTSVEITLIEDKHIKIKLSNQTNNLQEVTVQARKQGDIHTLSMVRLDGTALEQTRGASLGESLRELPGVTSLQTGPTLFKPVIHGLYSNRILIMNNGVAQEGQQWGAEHAPEIDPFTANNIEVIKGAASVRYGSDAIGGVILLNPATLPTEKGMTGDLYTIAETNGKMGVVSGMLQGAFDKKLRGLSWRVQGTARKAGNFRTPTYYLANTGTQEGDFSAELGYTIKGLRLDVYYSSYSTEVGIFAGAEANTLALIDSAFKAAKPFAPSLFTYKIDRSYQTVNHRLLKSTASYLFQNGGKIELNFALQTDVRNEYSSDVQYNINPQFVDIPQLIFQLNTQTLDLTYHKAGRNGFSGSFGIAGMASGNLVQGIFYLVPNFRSYNGGAFAIERYTRKKLTLEAGLRYDYRWLQVFRGNQTNLSVTEDDFTYSKNVTGTIGAIYQLNGNWTANGNIGTGWRAPSINEMFIDGVHFSNAQFEIGDSTLKVERSMNSGFSVNYNSTRLRGGVDVYYNIINNYIYEKPTLGFTPVYGVFYPTFQFTQSNVTIKGTDLNLAWDLSRHITLQSKTTIVRGYNESIHNYLIYMPADRFQNEIIYHFDKLGKLRTPYVSVENFSVLRQVQVPPNSDYEPTPAGFSLYNAHAGFVMPLPHGQTLRADVSVNNITNIIYRDYLDQYRYFANELGTNLTVRLKYSF